MTVLLHQLITPAMQVWSEYNASRHKFESQCSEKVKWAKDYNMPIQTNERYLVDTNEIVFECTANMQPVQLTEFLLKFPK